MKKLLALFLLFPLVIFAQSDPTGVPKDINLEKAIDNITNTIAGIAIGLGILFLIIAAIKFITAQGDEGKIKEARTMIIWVLIGVVIVLASKGLVNYVKGLMY